MQVYHPPFVHLLTGLTLWTLPNRPDPRALSAWSNNPGLIETAWEVLDAFDRPLDVLIFPQHVVVMGLTLILGAVLFRWAKAWHGRAGGVLALFVYTFSPNILAHGRLVTTDLAFTCCFALAVYTFQRLMVQPSIKRMVMAGLTLELALGSKMSALMLIPYLLHKLGSCGRSPDRATAGTVRRPARASLPRFIEMIPHSALCPIRPVTNLPIANKPAKQSRNY